MRTSKITVRYRRCDDRGTQEKLSSLDFSQAFDSTQLGNTLCYSNPMEQKMFERSKVAIDKEKRRKQNTFFLNQRAFFIKQVFTKGLTLHNSEPKRERMITRETKTEDPTEHQENLELDGKDTNDETDAVAKKPKKYITKSHTVGDLSKPDKLQNAKPTELKLSQSNLELKAPVDHPVTPAQPMILPKITTNKGLGFGRSAFAPPEEDVESLPPIERPSSATSGVDYLQLGNHEKRTVVSLRGKAPNEIYPKLTSLVVKYNAGKTESENEANETQKEAEKEQSKKRKVTTSIRITPIKEFDSVKLFQKLSTNLPSSLLKKAERQIHQISNSEEIYANKERLLVENKEAGLAVVTQDTRWLKLHNSLGETHGVGLRWRKIPGVQRWITI